MKVDLEDIARALEVEPSTLRRFLGQADDLVTVDV
jgi:hypothetical protein